MYSKQTDRVLDYMSVPQQTKGLYYECTIYRNSRHSQVHPLSPALWCRPIRWLLCSDVGTVQMTHWRKHLSSFERWTHYDFWERNYCPLMFDHEALHLFWIWTLSVKRTLLVVTGCGCRGWPVGTSPSTTGCGHIGVEFWRAF